MLHAASRSGKGSGIKWVFRVVLFHLSLVYFCLVRVKECEYFSPSCFSDIGAGLCRRLPCSTKGYTKGAVTQNVGEKGVNSVLDYVSSSNDWNLLKGFYEQTLDTLRRVHPPPSIVIVRVCGLLTWWFRDNLRSVFYFLAVA